MSLGIRSRFQTEAKRLGGRNRDVFGGPGAAEAGTALTVDAGKEAGDWSYVRRYGQGNRGAMFLQVCKQSLDALREFSSGKVPIDLGLEASLVEYGAEGLFDFTHCIAARYRDVEF